MEKNKLEEKINEMAQRILNGDKSINILDIVKFIKEHNEKANKNDKKH
tara:strand:+ start:318 stop:461 length:144 start_codon:yes stop_codon:yes gene_type:complete